MGKRYRAYSPEQSLLLPANLRDRLPDDHLVYFVSDVVDELDLLAIAGYYEAETRGQPPYHPRQLFVQYPGRIARATLPPGAAFYQPPSKSPSSASSLSTFSKAVTVRSTSLGPCTTETKPPGQGMTSTPSQRNPSRIL